MFGLCISCAGNVVVHGNQHVHGQTYRERPVLEFYRFNPFEPETSLQFVWPRCCCLLLQALNSLHKMQPNTRLPTQDLRSWICANQNSAQKPFILTIDRISSTEFFPQ
uniref:Uncharacterized protein n=1 Tax=Triticum urartu TaxID=4572 RepID=A0A8R7JUZ3_TRIUA